VRQCAAVWQCVVVQVAVCGSACDSARHRLRAAVCGSVAVCGSAAVCDSARGSVRQCGIVRHSVRSSVVRQCARQHCAALRAERQCSGVRVSVRQCAAVCVAVCGSVRGSVRQCARQCARQSSVFVIVFDYICV
jgi:hypothetical protein